MAITRHCDYCEKEIGDRQPYVTLSAESSALSGWDSGWVAHYHDDPCYALVSGQLDLINGVAKQLADLPTTSRKGMTSVLDAPPLKAVGPGTGALSIETAVDHPGTASALRRAGIRTLEEAAEWTRLEILSIDRVGIDTLRRVEAAMSRHGLAFEPGPDEAQLGAQLRRMRQERGLSQPELARAVDPDFELNLGGSAVGLWESGRRPPSSPQLERLAQFFGMPVDAIKASAVGEVAEGI